MSVPTIQSWIDGTDNTTSPPATVSDHGDDRSSNDKSNDSSSNDEIYIDLRNKALSTDPETGKVVSYTDLVTSSLT